MEGVLGRVGFQVSIAGVAEGTFLVSLKALTDRRGGLLSRFRKDRRAVGVAAVLVRYLRSRDYQTTEPNDAGWFRCEIGGVPVTISVDVKASPGEDVEIGLILTQPAKKGTKIVLFDPGWPNLAESMPVALSYNPTVV